MSAMNKLTLLLLKEDIDLAQSLGFKTLRSAKKLNNHEVLSESLDNLGHVYFHKNNVDSALKYFDTALNIRTKHNDNFGIAKSKTNIGLVYFKTGNFDASSALLNEALSSWKVIKDSAQIAKTQSVLGEIYHRKNLTASPLATEIDANKEKIAELRGLNTRNRYERALLFVLIGLSGLLSAFAYVSLLNKRKDAHILEEKNKEMAKKKAEMANLLEEMEMNAVSLELLNKKLVEEIAERENIERSSFARDRFLATMSHEMRTPLNVITGLTHLLLENNPRPEQIEQLRTLQFSANELVVFINDVLDFSKIEAGKLELQYRAFDFEKVVTNVFHNFSQRADSKGLLLHSSFDSQIPKNIVGDEARVYQILTNLLNYCLEATSEGLVMANVSLIEQNQREAIVRIVVESTDGGVEHLLMSGSFQTLNEEGANFEKLDSSQLSLAITKRLIELQHGRFTVENIFGEATKFTVLMPFKIALTTANQITQLNLTDHSHLKGSHILLVEDNKINQLVVAKMLRKHGIAVVTADNGVEALDHMNEQDFDLVLMDIQMPEMDGYRTTAEIRNMESPNKSNVPIIALTSSAFLTEKEKAVLFGMNDHVGKPFSPEELMEKIAALLIADSDPKR